MGGTVTGEHGVGVEKLSSMCVQFSPAEREQMLGAQARLRPEGAAQPRQGDPDAAPLRRVRKDARRARRCCRFADCRASERHVDRRRRRRLAAVLIDRVRSAQSADAQLGIRGGGTKAFYGEPPQGEPLDTARARRHHQLRADRAGRHRALRHAAGRARGGARRAGPVPALRAAALRRRRHRRRHGRRRPGRARRAPRSARCATTCSAPRCSTAAARC